MADHSPISFQHLRVLAGLSGEVSERPVVCIQGLGFVGAAMAAAVALARDDMGDPIFNVIGVDLLSPEGSKRIEALNQGRFPFESVDAALDDAVDRAHATGNLVATNLVDAYTLADVVVVDIHLDVQGEGSQAGVDFTGFRNAIACLGRYAKPGCLVVVETTVPPGTCEKVVVPALAEGLRCRGLPEDALLVAHSYERVMPGDGYLDSIINYWRVYAGHDEKAAAACEAFLSKVINIRDYPLTRLPHTVASETAKVLENSYRAMTIAFMEEFGRFAEAAGFDLFKVVEAIRMRPTHNNMRTPGFGVGGYCLTKDPLLPLVGARDLLGRGDLDFPFCRQAIQTNRAMPLVSVERLETLLDGVGGRRILLLGVSYRPGVADTRYSPSQTFVESVRAKGGDVVAQDPMVGFWEELGEEVLVDLPSPGGFDAVVMAVSHDQYRQIDFGTWLGPFRPLVLDTGNVLDDRQRALLRQLGCRVESIGRGDGL